jgi:hypothetical protein
MRLMEKTKYLEPHFSCFALPIVRYASHKFRLASSDLVSSLSAGGNHHQHGSAIQSQKGKANGLMDTVDEEEENVYSRGSPDGKCIKLRRNNNIRETISSTERKR